MLHGDDVQAVSLAEIQRLYRHTFHRFRQADFRDADVVAQGDVLHDPWRKQAVCQTNAHIPLRIDDLRPKLLQHTALFHAVCLGDDSGHAKLNDRQRGENAHINFTADAHNDGVTVLDADVAQVLPCQLVYQKGVVCESSGVVDD